MGAKRLLPFSENEISYDKAMDLWRLLLKGAPGNITLVESTNPSPSPITALLDLMNPPEQRKYYSDVDFYDEDYSKYYLTMSEKEKSDKNSMKRFEMYKDFPKVEIKLVPAFNHGEEYGVSLADLLSQNRDALMALNADIEAKALEMAASLVAPKKAKKLPANAGINDYLGALSKANQKKVAKFMKSTPNELDRQNYSATDLRLLLDLKCVYNLPVDELLKDFVGQNVEEYIRIVFGSECGNLNESMTLIADMVRAILQEELEETATMSGGNVVVGGSIPVGKKKKDKEKKVNTLIREDEDEVNEACFSPSELPIANPRAASTITVTVIPSSRHKTGGVSDAGYKKAISNKFKFDIAKSNIERAPYYDEGDIVTDLVEKVLRNIIRTN